MIENNKSAAFGSRAFWGFNGRLFTGRGFYHSFMASDIAGG